jgi:4-amino-4-deoxy-L-arabinose transferase-like glycosyltransferase
LRDGCESIQINGFGFTAFGAEAGNRSNDGIDEVDISGNQQGHAVDRCEPVARKIPSMNIDSTKFLRRAVPILVGLTLLGRAIGMGLVPLMDTTEARYGEIARKMAELNDWVTPWFDYGVPYWGKPPLAFWLTATSFKVFGVNEFAARLLHWIASLIIIALVWALSGRRDRDAAMPTVAVISASALFFVSAGAVMTDIELTVGTTLAMTGFWLALDKPKAGSTGSGWLAALLFFGGLATGLLAKGPVALVLAGTPLFLWTAYNRRWLDVWRRLPWIRGVLGTLIITLPWYWIAEQRTPGFLAYFLIGEHWHRFVTPDWQGDRYGHAHTYPIGTIWAFAFIGTLPWSLLLPIAAWRWRKDQASAVTMSAPNTPALRSDEQAWQSYLLVWAFTPLLFFTAARNITMAYVLPGIPAAAILTGSWLAQQRRQGRAVNQLLSVGMLITLLLVCRLAIYNGEPFHMERRSLKALVTAYDQARATQSNVPLVFVGLRPFSAQFYSHGHAIQADSIDQFWRRIGTDPAYVAIPSRYSDALIASAAAHETRTESNKTAAAKPSYIVNRVYRHGNYDLFYVAAH